MRLGIQTLNWTLLIIVLALALHSIILWKMGQPFICNCGVIKFWEGEVFSSGNSQHLTDWYTFSHIIHGFLFYFILWFLFPNMPVGQRLFLAIGLEMGWEIIENTDFVINRYRDTALAQGYIGYSIINSVMDLLTMIIGFIFAWRAPIWLTLSSAIIMELFTGYYIRDGLLLNIINFIHPLDSLNNWQINGG